jgi:ketosteroid isomerase-like protein
MNTGDTNRYLASLPDDYTHTIPGKSAFAGTRTKAQLAEVLQGTEMIFPKGLKMTIKGMIAEGDRVAVEAESYGETAEGKVYNNEYHWLFEIRDGKIRAAREYMCTAHAVEFFGPLMAK